MSALALVTSRQQSKRFDMLARREEQALFMAIQRYQEKYLRFSTADDVLENHQKSVHQLSRDIRKELSSETFHVGRWRAMQYFLQELEAKTMALQKARLLAQSQLDKAKSDLEKIASRKRAYVVMADTRKRTVAQLIEAMHLNQLDEQWLQRVARK